MSFDPHVGPHRKFLTFNSKMNAILDNYEVRQIQEFGNKKVKL